jgi:hypothetical protein
MLQEDAHQAAIDAARPHLAKNQPWRAINAAVDATLTTAMLAQVKTHDLWLENLPDQIRAGNLPTGLVAEIAAACATVTADAPTVLLRLPSRAELDPVTVDVPA